jgi:hypothetical protein
MTPQSAHETSLELLLPLHLTARGHSGLLGNWIPIMDNGADIGSQLANWTILVGLGVALMIMYEGYVSGSLEVRFFVQGRF